MGAKYYLEAAVGASVLPNVQSISFSYGRSQPTDDFQAASVQITGILPDDLPAGAGTIGTDLVLTFKDNATNTDRKFFFFKVQNLVRTYGTTSNLDTWSISGVGLISPMTTQQLTTPFYTTPGSSTTFNAAQVCNAYSISNYYDVGLSTVSSQTYDVGTYVNDIVQELMRTEQGRIQDCVFNQLIFLARSTSLTTLRADFNDGTVTPLLSTSPYTAIEFLNDGDYVANTIIVEPVGLTAETTGSSRPVLNFQTLDQSSTQAKGLSEYIKTTLDLNTIRPFAITFLADAQTNFNWLDAMQPGVLVSVALRGSSYLCVVEGASVVSSPSVSQVVLNLSTADMYRTFRLDNAEFGTLDNNRLGF